MQASLAPRGSLRLTVPATAGNLGAGFDVLGLAFGLYNEFTVTPAEYTRVEVDGPAEGIARGADNLFYRAFAHLHAVAGQPAPPLHIQMLLRVPPGRGLGSSATAVVGGLLAANAYLGLPYSAPELLVHAVALEHGRHPDNVAPALLGGLVVNVVDGERVISVPIPFPAEIQAVIYLPEFVMDTVEGRALMPAHYSRADVVFNSSRVALWLAAITGGRYDLLRVAMEDRLHQPYRAQLFPQMPALIAAALDAGACGACLSGGGSAILALATGHFEAIAAALEARAAATGLTGRALILPIDIHGARIVREAARV